MTFDCYVCRFLSINSPAVVERKRKKKKKKVLVLVTVVTEAVKKKYLKHDVTLPHPA